MESTSVSPIQSADIDTTKKYNSVKFWLTFLIMILIAYWLIVSIGFNKLVNGLEKSWPFGLLAVFFIYSIVMLIRVVRWKLLLQTLDVNHKYSLLTKVSLIAWAQNGILPARLGELSRLIILKEHGTAYSHSTSSIIMEKFFDLLGLMTVLAITALVFILTATQFLGIEKYRFSIIIFMVLVLVGFVMIGLLFKFPIFFENLLSKLPILNKGVPLLRGVVHSVSVIIRDKKLFSFIFLLSALQWFIESTTIVIIAITLGAPSNFTVITFAAIIGYSTYILPFTPGSFGPFEFFVAQILLLFLPITDSLALNIPTITHILVVFYLAIASVIATFLLKFELKIEN